MLMSAFFASFEGSIDLGYEKASVSTEEFCMITALANEHSVCV